MKKIVFSALLGVILIPIFAFAQISLNLEYPSFGGFNPETDQSLPELIAFIYFFIVGIAGLAAFVMLVWGGIQWVLSGAAPSQATQAREKIRSAIIGLLLVVSSFLILQAINPELTILRGSAFEVVDCTLLGAACESRNKSIETVETRSAFLINGSKTTTVDAGDSIELTWDLDTTFTLCDGISFEGGSPSGLWDVDVPADAPHASAMTVGPINTQTIFRFNCSKPGYGTDLILQTSTGVSFGGPQDPTPTVDLKIDTDRDGLNLENGPVLVDPVPDIDLYLFVENATECWGGPEVPYYEVISEFEYNTSIHRGPFVGTPPPFQITFDITCFNDTGQSARDEVIMNIRQP